MDPIHDNVFLIGPMGSGKTTLGRRVADALGLEFVDCDQEIEELTGANISLIFDIEGEEGFRDRETQVLKKLSTGSGQLIATGGGVVTRQENRQILKQSGYVVWLRTSVRQQLKRLGRDKARPLLQTPDRADRLHKLARERDPLYAEVADLVFESRNKHVKSVATTLAEHIAHNWRTGERETNDANG